MTFLRAAQVRPDFHVGCPGFSSDPAIFDGSTCVTTPEMGKGQTFTVIFPIAGNFKLVCLIHANMDGTDSCSSGERAAASHSGVL